jgi:dTMP kinase
MIEPLAPTRGKFITLEGGEGAGKSTQARLLAEHLRSLGHECVVTREPGGSPVAEALREVILSGVAAPLGPSAETVLFAAARIDHVVQTILPALARGAFVVCDRFTDSTRVYQGALGKVDPGLIRTLEEIATAQCRPDLTVMLDLPARIGLARAAARRAQQAADRYEAEGLAFHEGLRLAFLEIAASEPARCKVVDASQGPDKVAQVIKAMVQSLLEPPAAKAGNP